MGARLAPVVIVGLLAVGCTGGSAGTSPSTSSTLPTTEPAVAATSSTSTTSATSNTPSPGDPPSTPRRPDDAVPSSLDWTPCPDSVTGLECATLTAPLDHARPDGPTIDLAVARLPASDPDDRIGSLVFNPGGPGGSGIEFLELAQFGVPSGLTDVFDLVSFDPRGVGASDSVECDLVLDDGIALVADDDRAAWDRLLAEQERQLATCTSTVASLAAYVGTNNAARDLDLLRAALGDDGLSYVGFSYGTRLGATYAELFPDRVRALVLDGAVKPSDDFAALGAEQSRGFDRAFANFASACDDDPDCPLRELGPTTEVVATVRAEIAEVGSFETDDPERRLTPGELDLGIVAALYSRDAWPVLAQAIEVADTIADGTLLQVLADSYLGRRPDGTYRNQTEANSFINCADDAARPSVDEVWALADSTADGSRWFGDAVRASTGCLGIAPAVDPLVLGPAAGAAPILVIGTTGDPATPYEWAVEMADSLESGVLYTVEGEGHTAFTSIDCVAGVVEVYLVDLVVPDAGGSCADTAGDVFAPPGESELDQVLAFFDCLVEQGAPIDPVTLADLLADPTGEQILGDLDVSDPDLQAAVFACADLIPT